MKTAPDEPTADPAGEIMHKRIAEYAITLVLRTRGMRAHQEAADREKAEIARLDAAIAALQDMIQPAQDPKARK